MRATEARCAALESVRKKKPTTKLFTGIFYDAGGAVISVVNMRLESSTVAARRCAELASNLPDGARFEIRLKGRSVRTEASERG